MLLRSPPTATCERPRHDEPRLPSRCSPRAQSNPEGDSGDHGQDPRRRGHGRHRERLEVCGHGTGPALSHHLHRVYHLRHDSRSLLSSSYHCHLEERRQPLVRYHYMYYVQEITFYYCQISFIQQVYCQICSEKKKFVLQM